MIDEITQTLTAMTTFPQRSNYQSSSAYAAAVEAWLAEEQVVNGELISLIAQLLTFISQTNLTAQTVQNNADIATASASIASASANFKGVWDIGTTYLIPSSVSFNGINYQNISASNVGNQPDSLVGWEVISKADFIEVLFAGLDEDINTPITLTANGDPDAITYTNGYTEVSTYNANNDLETVVYKDATPTVLATKTYTYDANNLPYGVWS